MAVTVSADALARARAADPEERFQFLALAFAQYVPDLDMTAMVAGVRKRLEGGATLWDATDQWASVRSDACGLLRQMQEQGISVKDGGTAIFVPILGIVLMFMWLNRRRRH